MDGRTTIFDYWGIRSLQAWTNHGKFDGRHLTDDQKDLRLFYQRLLTVARDNKAVSEGKMYDLEYAQSDNFNKHEQFAYLRKQDDEVLLFVLNFDDRAVDVDVRVPEEAFRYLEQPEWQNASAEDLLTGKKHKQMSLCSSEPVHISLPAWKGVILRIEETGKKKRQS